MFLPPDLLIEIIHYTPLVSVDLVVRGADGRVLLGWRANRPAQNCWFVPGGRICKDERIAAAFRRISQTELGIPLNPEEARFLGVYQHFYEDNFLGREGFGTHYIVLGYEIRLAAPLPLQPDEQHEEYHWFSVEELLADPDVHPNTKAYFLPG